MRNGLDKIEFSGSIWSWSQAWEKLLLFERDLWQVIEDDGIVAREEAKNAAD